MKKIPYGKQFIDNKDLLAVTKALKKDKITTGDVVKNFEYKISNFLKCKHTISCNSGTSAIFLAMQSIGLKKNSIVLMPSINFVSSYNIASIFGAKIFLTDVDSRTGQMRPEDVVNCCNKFNLKKVDVLIVMYNGGYPDNIEKFIDLKKKYNFFLIEDACHALGASYVFNKKKLMVGSCKHSDLCTFSLHPLKSITTGEGGLVTTNNKLIADKIKKFCSLGIKRSVNHWEYDVIYTGLNFRLNDFQSALGISQLNKINKFINFRKKVFNHYQRSLKKINQIQTPFHEQKYNSSFHLYVIQINNFTLKQKNRFIKYMQKKNIIIQYHYIPIYKFKVFKGRYSCPNSKVYYNCSVSLPIYYGLSKKKQNYIINIIKDFFNEK